MVRTYIYHINWCRISSIKQYLQIRLLIDLRFAHFGCRFFKGGQNALHPRLPQVLGAQEDFQERNLVWNTVIKALPVRCMYKTHKKTLVKTHLQLRKRTMKRADAFVADRSSEWRACKEIRYSSLRIIRFDAVELYIHFMQLYSNII